MPRQYMKEFHLLNLKHLPDEQEQLKLSLEIEALADTTFARTDR